MSKPYWRGEGETSDEPVDEGHPLPVKLYQGGDSVPVSGRTVKIGPLPFLTGAGAIYAATDAMGNKFEFACPKSGLIQGVRILDFDDDTFTAAIHLFSHDFTATADNAVFAVSDDDLLNIEASILVDSDIDTVNSKLKVEDNLGVPYTAPEGKLYGAVQLQTGTPTIAAGVEVWVVIYILADG